MAEAGDQRGSNMKCINKFSILGLALIALLASSYAQASNVGWNISVGGGYGGGWRPAAYGGWGPGWGPGWGSGWRGNWGYPGGYYGPYVGYYNPPAVVYAPPPVVTYTPPPQPVVLAAQPEPAVWYYCEVSGKYYPYVQECPAGWQTQAPTLPSRNSSQKRQQN